MSPNKFAIKTENQNTNENETFCQQILQRPPAYHLI